MSTLASVVQKGTFAARPAASIAGIVYYATDTGKIYRDNGASWDDVTPTSSGGSGAVTKIAEQVLAAAAASVTFSSIAASYRHLRLVVNARTDANASTGSSNTLIQFNGDTATNYDYVNLYNNGTSAGATNSQAYGVNNPNIGFTAPGDSPAGQAGLIDILINNYSQTTFWKNAASLGTKKDSTSGAYIVTAGVTWHNTAAISSILLATGSGNFVVGSSFSLYGIS